MTENSVSITLRIGDGLMPTTPDGVKFFLTKLDEAEEVAETSFNFSLFNGQ